MKVNVLAKIVHDIVLEPRRRLGAPETNGSNPAFPLQINEVFEEFQGHVVRCFDVGIGAVDLQAVQGVASGLFDQIQDGMTKIRFARGGPVVGEIIGGQWHHRSSPDADRPMFLDVGGCILVHPSYNVQRSR